MSSPTSTVPSRAAIVIALLAGAYIAAQVLADVASLRLVDLFGRAIDGGTFIYPLTFTLRDLIHKAAGKKVASHAIKILMNSFFGSDFAGTRF